MKKVIDYIKTQIPFEIKRPSSILSIIIALIISGFFLALGGKIFEIISGSVSIYSPQLNTSLAFALGILTYSIPIKVNIVSLFLFVVLFFTAYRFVDRKILQRLNNAVVFEDDFEFVNKGWALNYWGSNNPDKTCKFENSNIVFEANDQDLINERKEYGAYFDLTSGIYEDSKYEISCWVKSEKDTTMGFKLWVHDTKGSNEMKFPANFYTPGVNFEEVKVGFLGTSSQALRIHLHNKAGEGKILVDRVVVTKVI